MTHRDDTPDGIEIRVKSFAVVCSPCIRLAMSGAAQHPKKELLCDGYSHALVPDGTATLCGIAVNP